VPEGHVLVSVTPDYRAMENMTFSEIPHIDQILEVLQAGASGRNQCVKITMCPAEIKFMTALQTPIRLNRWQPVEKRGWASEQDFADLLAAGYGRQQVLVVILGVARKLMSNFSNHVASTPLDKAFERDAWDNRNRSVA
jgi:hypothetical protein